MAKTKQERVDSYTSLFAAKMAKLEEAIEEKLDKEYDEKGKTTLFLDWIAKQVNGELSGVFIEKIVDLYARLGYQVTYVPKDQKDEGGWISIE